MRTQFLQPFIRMNGWSFGLRVCFVPLSHIVRRWNSHHLAGMLDSAQGSLRLTSPSPELTPSSANPHRRPPLRPNMHSITRALRTIRISLLAPCASIVFTLGCAGTTKVASSPAAPTSLDSTTSTAEPNSAPIATAPPVRQVETFDAVWTTVRDSHFDKSLNGVDWVAVRDELRPAAIAAGSQDELRAILLDMLARLGQSHFTIIPGEVADRSPTISTPEKRAAAPTDDAVASTDGTDAADARSTATVTPVDAVDTPGVSGLDIALVDGEPTVLRVSPGLGGAKSGVLPGWTLVKVDGQNVSDSLRSLRDALALETDDASQHARLLRTELAVSGSALLTGRAGETSTATFATEDGTEIDVNIAFEPAPYGSTQFGNLPPLPVEVESRVIEVDADGAKPVRVGVISFNIWMTAASPAIDRAVDALRTCDGIVVDLRGNPGGVGAMSMGVAGHFLTETASLGSMIGRDNTLEFKASPRKVSTAGKRVRPYSRPLAIVVDARSASTSEVFAGGLQDLGRARVFGETSAGMALPAQAIELPNGDVLLHAIADFVTSKGVRLEGRGVVPDEAVTPTRASLLAGDDPAIDAAKAWIAGRTIAARNAKNAATALDAASVPISMPNDSVPNSN